MPDTKTIPAASPWKIAAFGTLFTALAAAFEPTVAYIFTLVAYVVMAKV